MKKKKLVEQIKVLDIVIDYIINGYSDITTQQEEKIIHNYLSSFKDYNLIITDDYDDFSKCDCFNIYGKLTTVEIWE